jgi:hypothetical protein
MLKLYPFSPNPPVFIHVHSCSIFSSFFLGCFSSVNHPNHTAPHRCGGRCGGGAFAIAEWQVFGVPAENLAQGIVPSGSSDSKWGRFAVTWTTYDDLKGCRKDLKSEFFGNPTIF